MVILRLVTLVCFVLTINFVRAQDSASLAVEHFAIDKKVELEQKKFVFVDTGVLKKALRIRVFWNDRVFFNQYDEDKILDCFTFSSITDDTISVVGYMIGMLGYGFSLKIFGDSCLVAPYAISDGNIYRIAPGIDSFTSQLILPSAVHKVRLARKPLFKAREIVSGHVYLKSVPFYYKDLEGEFVIEINAHFRTAPLKPGR